MKIATRFLAIYGSALAVASSALATTPTMDPVSFPIDLSSIVTAVVAAGATLLLLTFGVQVGFRMAHKVKSRVMKAA